MSKSSRHHRLFAPHFNDMEASGADEFHELLQQGKITVSEYIQNMKNSNRYNTVEDIPKPFDFVIDKDGTIHNPSTVDDKASHSWVTIDLGKNKGRKFVRANEWKYISRELRHRIKQGLSTSERIQAAHFSFQMQNITDIQIIL